LNPFQFPVDSLGILGMTRNGDPNHHLTWLQDRLFHTSKEFLVLVYVVNCHDETV
jgi:hypothetical protein